MPKDVLIYGEIFSWSAQEFIAKMDELAEEEITARINTGGGDPSYGWGMVTKFLEHKSGKKLKVDGKAYSFGAFFCLYVDEVEALDVSEFLIHRAAYPEWVEKNPEYFTEELKSNLKRINTSLEKALRNKIDVAAFEEMKGVTVKEIFSMDSRIDVFLSAQEAKKIKLISSITKITPTKKAEIDTAMFEMAAKYPEFYRVAAEHKPDTNSDTNKKSMTTLDELKAKHPELYAKAVAEGVAQEKDRAGAWLAFVDIDPEAVSKGIKEGKAMTQTEMAEFTRKSISAEALAKVKKENPPAVTTSEVVPNADEGKSDDEKKKAKSLAEFEAEAKMHLGLATDGK